LPPQHEEQLPGLPVARGRVVPGETPPPRRSFTAIDPLYRELSAVESTPTQGSLPLALAAGEAALFDFGKMTIGLPRVVVQAAPGTVITLRAGERIEPGV